MEANKAKQATISAGRILLLCAILGIALIGFMTNPLDDSRWWFEIFFISKAIAAIGLFAFWKLYNRWSKTDKWLKVYNNSCNKALEATNPCYSEDEEDDK